jgi:hypothetical protein
MKLPKKVYNFKITEKVYNTGYRAVLTENLFDIKQDEIVLYTEIDNYKSNNHSITSAISISIKRKRYDDDNYTYILFSSESIDWSSKSRFPFVRKGTFLISITKNQASFNRVPYSISDVESALNWLKPSEVLKAEKEKRQVVRQGDLYFIEMKKTNNWKNLDSSHAMTENETDYIITHNQHKSLVLSKRKKWKVIKNKSIGYFSD